MLHRGDFLKPAQTVEPGVPVVPPSVCRPTPPRNRLTFARWLVDRRSPTTARADRQSGLAGVLRHRPRRHQRGPRLAERTRPAIRSCSTGWPSSSWTTAGSLKDLHRLIVRSSTYRQSSKVTPELLAKDPYNRLLARGPRFRVDAEIVRDIALAASGLLDPQVGGPSVQPPAPDFLFQPPASYGPKVWKVETGPDRYRRALYTFRYRSVPYPVLQAFDAPNGDFSCVRRSRSNTPLQALTTLNEPLFLECAGRWLKPRSKRAAIPTPVV